MNSEENINTQDVLFENTKHLSSLPVREESAVVRSHGVWSEQTPPLSAGTSPESHCLTCSDEPQTARVISLDEEETGFALVEAQEHIERVDVSLLPHVAPGDTLLIHGGVAIAHPGVRPSER
ncbi:HypC/HybG/HupF family hydrogenase formation chaperone [Ktedonobacter racemifer]|uniref:Hydrogenase assembly chaperone hypC/hupF n=1 Tax=Ktedonobacter racemifer DSM 44963 TaxID=485913 RepID=D6TNZ6_KTERA|nr:HypC/HybG/HupF family hydrogenase formation chaperone [Ktedonobacter racemifer]EFH85532.1 hypothetical protein Krac_6755 [Ktedonobacter racemifer DSM 44963]